MPLLRETRRLPRFSGIFAVAAAVLAVPACEGDGTGPERVDSVQISPDTTFLRPGGNTLLAAVLFDRGGNPVTGPGVAWASLDPAVFAVDAAGRATAQGCGSGRVTATSQAKADTARVIVTNVDSVSVGFNLSEDLAVGGTFSAGALIHRPGSDCPVTITHLSTNPAVATVNPANARVTGVAPGEAVIVITADGRSKGIVVTVGGAPVSVARVELAMTPGTPRVGGSAEVTATAFNAAGAELDREVTFTSSNPAVAQIGQQRGPRKALVHFVGTGTAEIRGTTGFRTGSLAVTVLPPP